MKDYKIVSIKDLPLSEKKIVLFCTHGTGDLASSMEGILVDLPKSYSIYFKNKIRKYSNYVLY